MKYVLKKAFSQNPSHTNVLSNISHGNSKVTANYKMKLSDAIIEAFPKIIHQPIACVWPIIKFAMFLSSREERRNQPNEAAASKYYVPVN